LIKYELDKQGIRNRSEATVLRAVNARLVTMQDGLFAFTRSTPSLFSTLLLFDKTLEASGPLKKSTPAQRAVGGGSSSENTPFQDRF
jgi:hypothetical protein